MPPLGQSGRSEPRKEINFLTGIAAMRHHSQVRNSPWATFFDGVTTTRDFLAAPLQQSRYQPRFYRHRRAPAGDRFFSSSVGSIDTVPQNLTAPLLYIPRSGSLGQIVRTMRQPNHRRREGHLHRSALTISTTLPTRIFRTFSMYGFDGLSARFSRRHFRRLLRQRMRSLLRLRIEEEAAKPLNNISSLECKPLWRTSLNKRALMFPATIYYAFKQSEITARRYQFNWLGHLPSGGYRSRVFASLAHGQFAPRWRAG